MIAPAYLNQWASRTPWPQQIQIEQDLILSRLIVEIAQHELLGAELSFRGGTCLHKLHFATPLRYSEDLDYVRRTHSGVGPYLDALREVAVGVGLNEHSRDSSGQMVHMVFDAEPTGVPGRIRVKVETNIAETESFRPRISRPYAVDSRWWSGNADVGTFEVEELMSTKLRALYQRRKGRDLFDLWHALTDLELDDQLVVDGLAHYMRHTMFGSPAFAANVRDKLGNAEFLADLDQLTTDSASGYDATVAADLVMGRLGSRLPGAPDIGEIEEGGWRA